MQLKGFYLSAEAVLSLLVLAALVAAQAPLQGDVELWELHVLQKENDLLKVWLIEGEFNEREMVRDFAAVFPGCSGRIIVDGREIAVGKAAGANGSGEEGVAAGKVGGKAAAKGREAVASCVVYFGPGTERHEVALVVFK